MAKTDARLVTESQSQLVAAHTIRREERRVGLLALCLLALVVGVTPGIGAVALRALIGPRVKGLRGRTELRREAC
jgi:hypothetical protein